MEPQWLRWAKMLQTMAQTGLTYAKDPYDIARYQAIGQIAFEMMAMGAQVEISHVHDLFHEERGHATPKVDVRAVIFKDQSILLVKERSDGGWTLPGGWADVGESPSEAVVREVLEESGYQVEATRLLAVYDREKHAHPPLAYFVYKLFFECKVVGGTAASSGETEDVAFFVQGALPPLSLTRVVPAQIERLFELHNQQISLADFD